MRSVEVSVSNANHPNCHDMASIFVHLLLPVAGLIIVWLKKDWITKMFVRNGGFYLPNGISDFWKDGSLLCTLINSAVPGACPNPYRHWRKPPEHAQEVAFKYLGVMPIFDNSELTSSVTPFINAKLLKYLIIIRSSIYNLKKERSVCSLTSSQFLARGMGLYTAEQFKPSEFFIYSKSGYGNFLNIEIIIFGPYCSCIKTTVSDYIVIKKGDKATNMVSKNIYIEIEIEIDRLRICYSTNHIGMHEIILSDNQENIRGSPFYVNVEKYEKNSFEKQIPLSNFEAETEKNLTCNRTEDKTDIKNMEIITEKQKHIFSNPDKTVNNNQQFEKISQDYRENILNEIIKDNKISNKIKINDNKVASKTNNQDKGEILEISKYLKNLSNTHEKEVNINKNLGTDISKENYSDFQKLVDSSYRKSCRITRTHPRLGRTKFAQFSYASPVCRDHTAPEDYRKLCSDSKRKMFSQKKSLAMDSIDTPIISQFSIDENKTEEIMGESEKGGRVDKPLKKDVAMDSIHTPIISQFSIDENETEEIKEESEKRGHVDEPLTKELVFSNLNEFEKATKYNNRPSLHRMVKEKRLFWESAFDDSNIKIQPNLTGDAESLKIFDKNLSRDLERNNKSLKSLDKLKKRVVSQSFNDRRTIVQKRILRPFRSLDDHLDMCCNKSLEDRTKSYFENVRYVTGKEIVEGTRCTKMFLSGKYGKKEKLIDDLRTTSCEALSLKNAKLGKSRSDLTPKKSFENAVSYFRNLEVGKIKLTIPNKPKSINMLKHLVFNKSDRSFSESKEEMESDSSVSS